MPLYKQWGVTHYTFDIIVLTSEKSFSRLHHRIFLKIYILSNLRGTHNLLELYMNYDKKKRRVCWKIYMLESVFLTLLLKMTLFHF